MAHLRIHQAPRPQGSAVGPLMVRNPTAPKDTEIVIDAMRESYERVSMRWSCSVKGPVAV